MAAQNFLVDRQRAYFGVFGDAKNLAVKAVLEDLARFCRANESCFHEDARLHAVAEGRREVWLRIRDHIDLKTNDLVEKYIGGKIQ